MQFAIYDERLSFLTVRNAQKQMITSKTATIYPANWTFDGSKAKGYSLLNWQTRLTMRTFNNECEVARWNAANVMEKRIYTAVNQINNANESMQLAINDRYVALKLEELQLSNKYRERLKIEKEDRAEMARA